MPKRDYFKLNELSGLSYQVLDQMYHFNDMFNEKHKIIRLGSKNGIQAAASFKLCKSLNQSTRVYNPAPSYVQTFS